MENRMICENCGAEFDAMEPKCPYCGHISISGAEKKFMGDLNQVKENLEEVSELPKKSYKHAMSKQSKFVAVTLIVVAALTAVLSGLFFLAKTVFYSRGNYDPKEELLWERENFPKLEEMYAQGDYEGILEFQYSLYTEDVNHSLYNWKHYDFIDAYDKYTSSKEIVACLDTEEELTKFQREDIVYYAIWFHYKEYESYEPTFTEEEGALVAGYREEMEQILYDRLHFTSEEADKLYDQCMKKGYFEMKPCFKYANKIYKRFS